MTENPLKSQNQEGGIWMLVSASLAGLVLLAGLIVGASRLIKPPAYGTSKIASATTAPSPSPTSSPLLQQPLQATSLTIGILTAKTDYQPLVDYLHSRFGNQVNIVIAGDDSTSYQEARDALTKQQWSIAFTLSPMLSTVAKANGYSYVARMFPQFNPYFESAIFVKSSSPIQSIADLTPKTTLALGDFNSASGFYIPAYDLYGKTIRVNMGNKASEIVDLVKTGKADAGAVPLVRVKEDPDLRVIQISKQIPGAGVYLSPQLSEADRAAIHTALLEAPIEVQKQANFGASNEVDYTNFLKITERVETLLQCSDFTRNPVNLFCPKEQNVQATAPNELNPEISGKVNGVSFPNAEMIRLTLVDNNQKIYQIMLPRKILSRIANNPPALGLNGKVIHISGAEAQLKNGAYEVEIQQPNQLQIP